AGPASLRPSSLSLRSSYAGHASPRRSRAAGLPSRSSWPRPAFAQMGFGVAAFTRFASEGWWAWPDSNQQPDRYERPALTIELQARGVAGCDTRRRRYPLQWRAISSNLRLAAWPQTANTRRTGSRIRN